MSKSLSSAMLDHLAGGVTTLATCWKIVRQDGTVMGFTDNVQDVVVSSITYEAQTGFTPTQLKSNATLSVDNMDITGLLDSDGITTADIEAKKYDDAEVYIFMVNYEDLTQGIIPLGRGRIGNITVRDNIYVAEYRSLTQLLQQNTGERYSLKCRAKLGDSRCGVPVNPSAWASSTVYSSGIYASSTSYTGVIFKCTTPGTSGGSIPSFNTAIGASTVDASVVWTTENSWTKRVAVTSATDARQFHASALVSIVNQYISAMTSVNASGFYNGGLLTWTVSAANSTYAMEVRQYTSDGRITLAEEMPYSIVAGDVFMIQPGCMKRHIDDCKNKFNNIDNFRGEPFIPGADKMMKFGGQ